MLGRSWENCRCLLALTNQTILISVDQLRLNLKQIGAAGRLWKEWDVHIFREENVRAPWGRKDEAWSSELRPLWGRKQLFLCCFVLHFQLRNSSSCRLGIMTSIFFSSSVAACQREGRRVALNNTLAFMEMYQMFQEWVSFARACLLARALSLSLSHSHFYSAFTHSLLTCVLSGGCS